MKFSAKIVKIFAVLLSVSLILGNSVSALAEETAADERVTAVSEPEEDKTVTEEAETVQNAAAELSSEEGAAEPTETEPGVDAAAAKPEKEAEAQDTSDPVSEDASSAEDGNSETKEASSLDTETEGKKDEQQPETVSKEAETVEETAPEKPSGKPQIKGEYTDDTKKVYRITITGTTLESNEFYRVKVWSKPNGNDDAKWTNFKKTEEGYEVLITISDYKDPGYYYTQIYLYKRVESGYDREYIGSSNFSVYSVTRGTISVSDLDNAAGTAVLKEEGVSSPSGIDTVRAEVYSTADKSDLFVYDMVRDEDGNWTALVDIANHGGFKAKYTADLFAVDGNGFEKNIGNTTVEFIPNPPTGKVSVPVNRAAGTFDINVKNLESDSRVQSVIAWVWTKSDASDRKFYTLNGSGSEYSLHKILIGDLASIAGMYHVRVFANTEDGKSTMLRNTAFTLKETPGTITYKDKITLTYGRMQRNYSLFLNSPVVKNGLAKIEFAVWNKNDTSNIKWYTGRLLETGQYYTNVKIADFRRLGQYITHIYITDQTGNRYFLTGAEIMNVDGTATGTISLSNCSPAGGTYVVNLKNASAPAGVSSINVRAWTKSDKSDSYTYSSTADNSGNFAVKINIVNHNYSIGTYHIEVNAVMGNGITVPVGTKDYNFNGKNNAFVLKNQEHYRLIGINNPTRTSDLKAAIWSEEGGQDDVQWIALSANGKQWTANVNLGRFLHGGLFHVHIYSGSNYVRGLTFNAPLGEAGWTGWAYESGYKFYYEYGIKKTDLTGMVGAPYEICINRQCCTVTVYALDGGNGFIIPVVAFACSVGLPGMETPTGYYYSDYKSRWEMLMGPSWGQYVTHVVEGIYIHSVAGYNTTSYNLSSYDYNNLGQPASHGCIRLNVRDAKWIYDHCPYGTGIYIYDSSWPGPFGKPATIKIPAGQNWDPTDPNL